MSDTKTSAPTVENDPTLDSIVDGICKEACVFEGSGNVRKHYEDLVKFIDQRCAVIVAGFASDERVFLAACSDLGLVNEALGLDPDDGGADPILSAIEDLKSQISKPPSFVEVATKAAAKGDWQELSKIAEKLGAGVEWANDPGEFHNIIKFTPPQLSDLLALYQAPAINLEEQHAAVRDAVADAMTCLYACTRCWSSWQVGTMTQDDFIPAGDDNDVVANVTDAAIAAMRPASVVPVTTDLRISFGPWREKLRHGPAPVLFTDLINGEQTRQDNLWIATTAQLASTPTTGQAK